VVGLNMRVSEIFYSIQGEGPFIGRPAVFIRLQGCNLRCTKNSVGWDCDTQYAWDFSGGMEISVDRVVDIVKQYHCSHIVITGGEPMLQQREVIELIKRLDGYTIEIETNGTIPLDPDFPVEKVRLNVSPKPHAPIRPEYIRYASCLKFVIASEKDLVFVDRFVKIYGVEPSRIWLMPASRNIDEHNRNIRLCWEYAKLRGYNVTPRLHILVYGEPREGV